MKQIIFQKFIYREDLQKNRHIAYLFGDNDMRQGNGGQAKEMRGESNAIGIRVKKSPGTDISAYYRDEEIDSNMKNISEDFDKVEKWLGRDRLVIIPMNGIGTGLARLSEFAPRTLGYVNDRINLLIARYNK